MNYLEILRPEVREAVEYLHDAATLGNGTPIDQSAHVRTIRAELLRLAMLETDALIALDCEHDWQVEHERAEKAEAELAALKARVAAAQVVEFRQPHDDEVDEDGYSYYAVPLSVIGKTVYLLVHEPPAERGEG